MIEDSERTFLLCDIARKAAPSTQQFLSCSAKLLACPRKRYANKVPFASASRSCLLGRLLLLADFSLSVHARRNCGASFGAWASTVLPPLS